MRKNINSDIFTRLKTIIIFSLIVIFLAQFSMNLFMSSFKISIGIIILPVFIFLLNDFPLLPVSFCSGIGVFISRFLSDWLKYGVKENIISNYMPEMFFYIMYGLLLNIYITKRKSMFKNDYDILYFVMMDYAANLTEILLRFDIASLSATTQISLIIVAVFRSFVIWAIITVLKKYHLSFMKEEHSNRYKRLMILISKLNDEIIWMKKNTFLIEETMNSSYKLFNDLRKNNADELLSKDALKVANDIHEIKKEYQIILRGISEAMQLNLDNDGMYLEDIIKVTESAIKYDASLVNKEIIFKSEHPSGIYTDKHYFIMSIFRNIFTNSLEASNTKDVCIYLKVYNENNSYIFSIMDDGPGISEENIHEIFEPGFSTKINYDTGEINRGLGLNLVKDIVEKQFNGSICVESVPGSTTFFIKIPEEELRVK